MGEVLSSRSNFSKQYFIVSRYLLKHYILDKPSHLIHWTSLFVILRVSGPVRRLHSIFMEIPLANNVEPDQTPHYVATDLGLHYLPIPLLLVSR